MSNNTPLNGVLNTIRHEQGKLNPALQRIAKHILTHPEQVKSQSIKDLAEICKVSESTITRFVHAIDVPSYQQLKIGIAEALSSNSYVEPEEQDACIFDDISTADTSEEIIKKIRFRSVEAITSTANQLDPRLLDKAAKALHASSSITFFAMGSSCLAAENAVMRFMRIGKQCQFYRDTSFQQISATTLKKGVAAIGISDAGKTIQVVDSLKRARLAGATTIAVTSNPDAPLTRHADFVLLTSTPKAPAGFQLYHESMTSKVAQMLILDALYSCYAVKHAGESVRKLLETNAVLETSRY